MKILFAIATLMFYVQVHAETLPIATGEYLPFVSESEKNPGIAKQLIDRVFKQMGVLPVYTYMPWKRVYLETYRGKFAGAFPYLKTAEREELFYYSKPIVNDRFHLYAYNSDVAGWKNGVCIPLGYDSTQLLSVVKTISMVVQTPSTMEQCLQMLGKGRVDAVWSSELIFKQLAVDSSELKARKGTVFPIPNMVGNNEYYLIVSKTYPNAKRLIERFDKSLAAVLVKHSTVEK